MNVIAPGERPGRGLPPRSRRDLSASALDTPRRLTRGHATFATALVRADRRQLRGHERRGRGDRRVDHDRGTSARPGHRGARTSPSPMEERERRSTSRCAFTTDVLHRARRLPTRLRPEPARARRGAAAAAWRGGRGIRAAFPGRDPRSRDGRRTSERSSTGSAAPGCYLMKDRRGEVVYVGKASSLRSRVRSYFDAGRGDDRAFVALLDDLLGDLEVIVTRRRRRRSSSRTSSSSGTSRASTSGCATTRTSSSCASTSATRTRGSRCGARASRAGPERATSGRTRRRPRSARRSAS